MTKTHVDAEESVTARVLYSLTTLSELGLIRKRALWDLLDATVGFICHPNLWLRQGAAAFVASAAKVAGPPDMWCILYPPLRRLLRSDIADITEGEIVGAVTRPVRLFSAHSAECTDKYAASQKHL